VVGGFVCKIRNTTRNVAMLFIARQTKKMLAKVCVFHNTVLVDVRIGDVIFSFQNEKSGLTDKKCLNLLLCVCYIVGITHPQVLSSSTPLHSYLAKH
jgi:hypothetical protein